MSEPEVRLGAGVYSLHPNPNFNFQLNRTLHWGGGDLAELREAGRKITDTKSWERKLMALGTKAPTILSR